MREISVHCRARHTEREYWYWIVHTLHVTACRESRKWVVYTLCITVQGKSGSRVIRSVCVTARKESQDRVVHSLSATVVLVRSTRPAEFGTHAVTVHASNSCRVAGMDDPWTGRSGNRQHPTIPLQGLGIQGQKITTTVLSQGRTWYVTDALFKTKGMQCEQILHQERVLI